jgi:hypothetical protein
MEKKMTTSLKDHVTGKAHFTHFRDGQLWYVTDSHFEFPVPVSDTDGATFARDDKAMFFMRWIKQWMITLREEKARNTPITLVGS